MKKIFCPDIMLGNCIRSCWSYNIETIEDDKIPVNVQCKAIGTFALDIKPMSNDSYWMFSIPLLKTWEPLDRLTEETLSFELITVKEFTLIVFLSNSNDEKILNEEIKIVDDNEWIPIKISLPSTLSDVRLVSFSGPSNISEILVKNIKLT